jgi:hypothetical protein
VRDRLQAHGDDALRVAFEHVLAEQAISAIGTSPSVPR